MGPPQLLMQQDSCSGSLQLGASALGSDTCFGNSSLKSLLLLPYH